VCVWTVPDWVMVWVKKTVAVQFVVAGVVAVPVAPPPSVVVTVPVPGPDPEVVEYTRAVVENAGGLLVIVVDQLVDGVVIVEGTVVDPPAVQTAGSAGTGSWRSPPANALLTTPTPATAPAMRARNRRLRMVPRSAEFGCSPGYASSSRRVMSARLHVPHHSAHEHVDS
jgi:hypothetical protein